MLNSLIQYSGSDVTETDYSDVDYIPKIGSDESDGSSSAYNKAESSSDESHDSASGHDKAKSSLMHPTSPFSKETKKSITAPSPKRPKCQTKETDTLPGDRTFIESVPSSRQERKTYNKKQYCLYCSKPYSKMARHLEFVHHNEIEVAKAVVFPKHSKERRVQLNLLRKRGNFAHNTDVVRQGRGEMIACYRPKKRKGAIEFIHCIYCQGLYNKRSLWKHVKNCPLKPKDDEPQGRKRVRSLCALKTPVGLEVSKSFKKILSFMNYDEVSRVVHSDRCIMQLGEHMFNRMGSDVTKHDYIRQKMREVGRLLLEARKITPLRTMVDFFIPANFKHIISAVKVVSGYDEEKNSYRIPSLALKLGHSLNKICSIVESNAMMYGDHERAECARDFRKIHQARWNEYISAGAITTLKEAKWNAPQIIPFTRDVKVLHAHLEKKHGDLLSKLRSCPSSADSYPKSSCLTGEEKVRSQGCFCQLLKAGILLSCTKTSPSVFLNLRERCVCTLPELRSVVNEGERFLCSSSLLWFLLWSCSPKRERLVAFQLRIPLCLPDLEQCLPTEEESASVELLMNVA